MDPKKSSVIASQASAVTKRSRKRKRVTNLDRIFKTFAVKQKDYKAAYIDLKSLITEAYIPDSMPKVRLCIQCALQAIGLLSSLLPPRLDILMKL